MKLSIDTIIVIKDRNNVEKISVILKSTNPICIDEINIWRCSLNGKFSLLAAKQIDNKTNTLTISSDNDKIFYNSIAIDIPKGCGLTTDTLNIKIGSNTYVYPLRYITVNWYKKKYLDKTLYLAPTEEFKVKSSFPYFRKIINWSGDYQLYTKLIDSSRSIILLLSVFALFFIKNNYVRYDSKAIPPYAYYLLWTLCIIWTIVRTPFHLNELKSGLDPSWITALNWSSNLDYKWGKDIIFTYGPMYWLVKPSVILTPDHISRYFVITLIIYSIVVSFIYKFILLNHKHSAFSSRQITITISILLLFNFELLDYINMCILILLSSLIDKINKLTIIKVISACFLLAIASLVKFSYVAIAISLFILIPVISSRKKFLYSTIYILSYVIFLTGLWLVNDQSITDIYSYIIRGLDIASGYSEAMATPFWDYNTSFFSNLIDLFFLITSISILLIYAWIAYRTFSNNTLRKNLLLCAPLVFLSFKEGFVRFDGGHLVLFYSQLLLVTIFVYYIHISTEYRSSVSNKLVGIAILCLIVVTPYSSFNSNHILLPLRTDKLDEVLKQNKDFIKNNFPISQQTKKIFDQKSRVDIMPWDISTLYAYNANWKPRPVFQSYTVYTEGLSTLNTKWYSSKYAPQYIIYQYKSIDNRYPLYDEPELNLMLLSRYQPVENHNNNYLLLKLQERPLIQNYIELPVKKYTLNSKLSVVSYKGTYTVCSVDAHQTLAGKILNFFYKIPPLSITMFDSLGRPYGEHRLVRKTANENLIISSYVNNLNTYRDLFSHNTPNKISYFKINGNPLFYDPEINIKMVFIKMYNKN
ncbi:hypothetical protein [Spirosoma sordidisoli]|uniref:Uncharacterized protein n=1 Tax=Spirosoma sordidisoli TaxID=2502893 RepID=A0A4Q2UM10_9BACT|nr:hypothetical protein [Spirosoma sordidisoli]RYC68545.1 hypothetical protein EQG79_19550 [Spirosoma sordidisoli]